MLWRDLLPLTSPSCDCSSKANELELFCSHPAALGLWKWTWTCRCFPKATGIGLRRVAVTDLWLEGHWFSSLDELSQWGKTVSHALTSLGNGHSSAAELFYESCMNPLTKCSLNFKHILSILAGRQWWEYFILIFYISSVAPFEKPLKLSAFQTQTFSHLNTFWRLFHHNQ